MTANAEAERLLADGAGVKAISIICDRCGNAERGAAFVVASGMTIFQSRVHQARYHRGPDRTMTPWTVVLDEVDDDDTLVVGCRTHGNFHLRAGAVRAGVASWKDGKVLRYMRIGRRVQR